MAPHRELVKGKFIVFDGVDGCGKTTMFRRYVQFLQSLDVDVVAVREPGGTGYGEAIRNLLLYTHFPETGEKLEANTEMLLFMAARTQLMERVVIPALQAGKTVVADRFVSSTLAYQGHAGGFPWELILQVAKAVVPEQYWPQITVLLDVDPATRKERLTRDLSLTPQPTAGQPGDREDTGADDRAFIAACEQAIANSAPALDRIEQRDNEYQARVREGYRLQAQRYPHYCRLLDARPDVEVVFQNVVETINAHLTWLADSQAAAEAARPT